MSLLCKVLDMRVPERSSKIILGAALLAILGIPAVLGFLWLDHTRETKLPTPTGPFAVGRTTYVWSDPAHEDPLAAIPACRSCSTAPAISSVASSVLSRVTPRPPTTYSFTENTCTDAEHRCANAVAKSTAISLPGESSIAIRNR